MDDFNQKALSLFRLQAEGNVLYHDYLNALSVDPHGINDVKRIPFLPIRFFKTHRIQTGDFVPEVCFESSGTTGLQSSKHCIRRLADYLNNAEKGFMQFYGDPAEWCILALLPSYLERGNSSLVAMADRLIHKSTHASSGFFLNDLEKLHAILKKLEHERQKTLLLGVTYALVDFAEQYPVLLKHTVVMETGGMKGRKKEMTRDELHVLLKQKLGVETVHAEYGMTELQSQAYSNGGGIFHCASSMKVFLRSPDDPFEIWDGYAYPYRTGVINIVDLANQDTLAFIATDDLGKLHGDGTFEVLGRVDNADIRGCSLLSV